jgi:hypothetical protein
MASNKVSVALAMTLVNNQGSEVPKVVNIHAAEMLTKKLAKTLLIA